MADTQALADAIKAGVETVSKEQNVIVDDKPVAETTKVEATKEEKPKDGELSDTQLAEAKQLYSLINDPVKGPATIDWLARQAGYDKIKVETKEEVKEVKKEIKDVLKERLGPELEFLADKLGPAIDDILKEKLEEHTKDIRDNIQQGELAKLADASEKAYTKLSQDWFDKPEPPADVTERINELIDEIPAGKGMTAEKYMAYLFHIAVSEKGLVKKSATSSNTTERANKNRTDAASRLASERGARSQSEVTLPKTKMNINDAVAAAMETVNAQLNK